MNTHSKIFLRDVIETDLPFFYQYQLNEDAIKMTSFPARDEVAFKNHWTKILIDTNIIIKTIIYDEQVAGSILTFEMNAEREVGYWLGKMFWGKGIATESLKQFLRLIVKRPLFAHIAKQNIASKKVLEKCGFYVIGEDKWKPYPDAQEVDEFILRLDR